MANAINDNPSAPIITDEHRTVRSLKEHIFNISTLFGIAITLGYYFQLGNMTVCICADMDHRAFVHLYTENPTRLLKV